MTEPEPKQILIIGGGNSCRSIMAEAMLNHLGRGTIRANSGGCCPVGTVHPKAIEVLIQYGIDPGTPASKSWNKFSTYHFDQIIVVCENAATHLFPVFPGQPARLYWNTPDPEKPNSTNEEKDKAFEAAFRLLKIRVEKLFNF